MPRGWEANATRGGRSATQPGNRPESEAQPARLYRCYFVLNAGGQVSRREAGQGSARTDARRTGVGGAASLCGLASGGWDANARRPAPSSQQLASQQPGKHYRHTWRGSGANAGWSEARAA